VTEDERKLAERIDAMTDDSDRGHERWARLRFSIVGPLFSSPPPKGELAATLAALAAKTWVHPRTGAPVSFATSTIERWYYRAKNEPKDPFRVLRRRVRKDLGQHPAMGDGLRQVLIAQYAAHKSWSYQLHVDNLRALVEATPALGPMPSYSTVLRFMKAHGLEKRRRLRHRERLAAERAEERVEHREVRSYEAEYVHGLWHTDMHVGSLKVLVPDGTWATPLLLGVLDDRSRLCCHAQWYIGPECAENVVHGFQQAFQKRGLPRELLSDGGAGFIAGETEAGLERLGIVPAHTLAMSPYQNGKQEVFWAQVEGRLLAMLEGCRDLTLAMLNEATQAWVELEYNREVHSETKQTPIARLMAGPDAGRSCPSSDALRAAFTIETKRTQRKSDGTITLDGVRYEIPSAYRHLGRVSVRYARWDLGRVTLIDERTGEALSPIFPLDREKNADGRRRVLASHASRMPAPAEVGVAPLLRKLMTEYAATGLPPAYVPKEPTTTKGERR
jgi:transposase InsO family protein